MKFIWAVLLLPVCMLALGIALLFVFVSNACNWVGASIAEVVRWVLVKVFDVDIGEKTEKIMKIKA